MSFKNHLTEREGFVGTKAFVLYKLQILRGRHDPFCYERWRALPGIARWEGEEGVVALSSTNNPPHPKDLVTSRFAGLA